MKPCNRCGEANHDDARYCGTCGLSMSAVDQPSLDGHDDAEWSDAATQPASPAGDPQSSEYVSAPSFGETGEVSTPANPAPPAGEVATPAPAAAATAVVSSPLDAPSQRGHEPDQLAGTAAPPAGRPTSSSGVVIALLAVAAVVIVGGVFILLAQSPGDDDAGSVGGDPVASAGTVTETAPTADTAAVSPVDSQSVEPATVPNESVSASTAPTVTQDSSTTVAPEPAPTAPATPAVPSRGPGDLGLTQPILDEACDGRYITFVGSAVGDQPYGPVVDELLGRYDGTNYIWTKACPSLRQEFNDGSDIYGVVFGPYATQEEACAARAFGPVDAYVRRISTFDPQDHTINC